MTVDADIVAKLSGKFLVFDGPDGCGKTTQIELLRKSLADAGASVIKTCDPGGSDIGDRIRRILLGYDLSVMDVRCETLLFMASRAQLVSEVIEPALADGAVVICSRFISATYAYQGAAGYDISDLLTLGNIAVGNTWPDLTIILDVPVETGFDRTGRKPHHARASSRTSGDQGELFNDAIVDAMESRPTEFHRKVRDNFKSLPEFYPKPVHIVDGAGEADAVHARVTELLRRVTV